MPAPPAEEPHPPGQPRPGTGQAHRRSASHQTGKRPGDLPDPPSAAEPPLTQCNQRPNCCRPNNYKSPILRCPVVACSLKSGSTEHLVMRLPGQDSRGALDPVV